MRRASQTSILASLLSLAATASAQKLIHHVPLMPPAVGLNPIGIGDDGIAGNDGGDEVFLLSTRGVTRITPSTSEFVSFEIDPASNTDDVAGIAVEQGGAAIRRLYVTDQGRGSLHVIQADPLALVASIRVPIFEPRAVAVDPNRAVAFVLSGAAAQLAVVDLDGLAVMKVLDLDGAPDEVAVDPLLHRAYVTSRAAGALYRVELDPPRIAATIPLDKDPTAVAVNAALGRVYVVREAAADPALAEITIVDEADDAVVVSHPAGEASRLILNRDSDRAYTTHTDEVSGDVALVWLDGADSFVTGPTLNDEVGGFAIDGAGGRLFIAATVGFSAVEITVFDESSGMLGAPTATGGTFAGALTYHAPSDRVFLANPDLATVTAFDPTGSVGSRIETGVFLDAGPVNEIDPTAPRAYALVASRDEVAAVDTTTLATTPIPVAPLPRTAELLPASNRLLVLNGASDRVITTIDGATDTVAQTSAPLAIFATSGFAANPVTELSYAANTIAPGSPSLPGPEAFQSYDVDTNLLTDLAPAFPDPCFWLLSLEVAVSSTTDRAYLSALMFSGMSLLQSLVIRDEASGTWSCVAVPDGGLAFFLGVSETLDRVYWPRPAAGSPPAVVVIDPAAAAVVTAVTLPGSAGAFAVDDTAGRERLYASIPNTGELVVIDTASNGLLGAVTAGGQPRRLLATPAGDRLFAANDALASVQVLATASTGTGAVVELTDLESHLGQFGTTTMSLEAGQDRVYYANNRHGTLAVIDAAAAADDMQLDAVALPTGAPGAPYSATLTVTGGSAPHSFTIVSGALPPGLALDGAGNLTGTPTAEGTYSFMAAADDASTPSSSDIEDYQITVLGLTIVNRRLPGGVEDTVYSADLAAVGGVHCSPAPYQWSIVAGALPASLFLDPDGSIFGVPSTAGETCVIVEAADCNTPPGTVQKELCIDIAVGGCAMNGASLPSLAPPLDKPGLLFPDDMTCAPERVPATVLVPAFTVTPIQQIGAFAGGFPLDVFRVLCPCPGTLRMVKDFTTGQIVADWL